MKNKYMKKQLDTLSKESLITIISDFYDMLNENKKYISNNITDNIDMQIIYRIKYSLSVLLKNIIFSKQIKISKDNLLELGFRYEDINPFTGKPNWYFSKYQIENPEITYIDTATLIDFDLEKFEARYDNHIKKCETINELKQFIQVVKYLSNYEKLKLID
jgi:hypothetical protein